MLSKPAKQTLLIALGVIYLIALLFSHKAQSSKITTFPIQLEGDRAFGTILLQAADGGQNPLFVRRWGLNGSEPDSTPVVLLHGSPGSADNFEILAPILAQQNRLILAPDLPGYERSPMNDDLSYESQARSIVLLLDALGIDRAHIVGWSSGGGVAIQIAHLHPDRTASITLLAAIAAQETEGTGSYFFEHLKYAVGLGIFGYLPDAIPHFGRLGTFQSRAGWLQAFWDSDQRELTRIMPTIETPTLILHGRNDFLTTARAAERHHELMPVYSRLVMLDASHFIPFLQPEEASTYLNAHFTRHDNPNVTVLNEDIILAPKPDRRGFDEHLHTTGDRIYALPWSVVLIGIVLFVRFFPHLGVILTMMFVVTLHIDFGIAILGMLIGRTWWIVRGSNVLDRPWTILGWVRSIMFIVPAFVLGILSGILITLATHRFGIIGFVVSVPACVFVLRLLRLGVTREGRSRIIAKINRFTNHEYWVNAIIYFPVFLLFVGIRPFRAMARVTAVNPGYAPDGGVNEDSKSVLNARFGDDPGVLPLCAIAPDPDLESRYAIARDQIEHNQALGGFPIIAKPDRGEHGNGVCKLINNDHLRDYLSIHPEPIVLQKYHPGPCEVGVLWIRNPGSIRNPAQPAPHGFVYAITIKEFPVIVGDGQHSIRQLILRHPRFRCQSLMFLERLRDQQHEIPGPDEQFSLGVAGNHALGAKFVDGHHLHSDELEKRIGLIAERFHDAEGRGFDIGRFDLRCESHEGFMRGEFGIVELNGIASEPSNLYDPQRSIFWAWRVLRGYWVHAINLAEARIETRTGEPINPGAVRKKLYGWVARGVGSRLKTGA